jgi:hypothetical protein
MSGELRSRLALLASLVAVLLLASAAAVGLGATRAGAVSGSGGTDPALPPDCQRAVEFDPEEFEESTEIDNELLPLVPGTQLVLQGRANRTGTTLDHTVTFTVTNLVKVIHGVPTRVMWDVDRNEGELVEAELAFFAQDDDGNVWNLGEYPEEWEDGGFVGAPNTWIAGVADAEAGIHMLDWPDVGDTYMQGFAPEIDFLDCARVFEEDLTSCVPVGCFDDVLVTHERSPLDPDGGIQTKAHAPDVGIVEVGALNDPEGETLVLTERIRLDAASMATVRQAALNLEQRAYRFRPDVYGQTEPIEPLPPPAQASPPPPAVAPLAAAPTPLVTPAPPAAGRPPGLKPRSRPRSCDAKRSRRSARRGSRRASRRPATGGARAPVKKRPRKTCARRLSRR